jgi:hypothetical protein
MKKFILLPIIASVLAVATVAQAGRIITVNTANNADFSFGKTNLVQALTFLQDDDTVQFNIPGTNGEIFYIQTPVGGYPIITNNNITIDGYTQPGASANTNSIHAPNNAKIKICLDSRNGNATDMGNIENLGPVGQKYGFGHGEWAVLGVFRGTNAHIKGLAILSAPNNPTGDGGSGADIKSLSFGCDYSGSCENWHVSGCWIGIDPATGKLAYIDDGAGTTNIASPAIAIAAYRHRDEAGNNAIYPQPGIIGVAAGSANPRAEFNVICNGYGFDSEGLNFRISGNFWGVLPDGVTDADFSTLLDGAQMGDGYIEIGRNSSNLTIGTDGDGVNDADEGNVFGGFAMVGSGNMINLYSSPHTNIVIAGNWFGIGVDGVTRFTNSTPIVDTLNGSGTLQFGSDFDGVSDDLEGNVVYGNYPFSYYYPDPGNPNNPGEGQFWSVNAGARISFRGNSLVNNNLVPYSFANGSYGWLNNFTNYEALYMDTNASIIPTLDAAQSTYPYLVGTCAHGVAPYTNILFDVYQLDPEGWTNGISFQYFELGAPDATTGFTQGRKYLGSFVDNGALDLDQAVGSFKLNISALNVSSTTVTLTASYSADPAGTRHGRAHTSNFSNPVTYPVVSTPVTLGAAKSGSNLVLTWPQAGGLFTIEGTDSLSATSWSALSPQPTVTSSGNNYEATVAIGASPKYFRLRK